MSVFDKLMKKQERVKSKESTMEGKQIEAEISGSHCDKQEDDLLLV
jgi:hypothetical protein